MKKGEFGYVFGVISIVLAFFTPIAGFIFSLIGYFHSKGSDELSKKGKSLSIVGMIISIIVFALTIGLTVYSYLKNPGILAGGLG